MCSIPRKSWEEQRMKFSPSIKEILCFSEYICSLSLCKTIQAGWDSRPYHQVMISYWFNQEEKIFVQRSIFRELIWTKIIYHPEPQVNNCSDHLSCFKTPLRPNRNFKIVPTEKEVKILMRILLFTPSTKKYYPRHWELSLDMLNLHIAQRPHKAPLKGSNDQTFLFHFGQPGMTVVGRPTYFHSYLPHKTWTIEATHFLSILKYTSKSSFRNLRGRNEFIERWNPGAENNNKVFSSSCSYPQSHSLHAAYGRVHALQSAVNSPL